MYAIFSALSNCIFYVQLKIQYLESEKARLEAEKVGLESALETESEDRKVAEGLVLLHEDENKARIVEVKLLDFLYDFIIRFYRYSSSTMI